MLTLRKPDPCLHHFGLLSQPFWLFGGGTHGHPRGSRAGARADRVATEAIASGKTLDDAAKTCSELSDAMELWGQIKFGVSG